ncbi:glutathione S-transferase family protein [Niveibacterium microcysteis]|uniref:Glutathione S-transferase N-terminal domain-containing protein n=1 Tax=Niveibacterium microcysteis TaxID=2811415 RepID=A0ABX7M609_9RHOO|nr:glutathione binding-like protein [Niveibacterium microcysteis]QSI76901.1 glutathione S-transferase N-terminal domain-containing protein [Niveibacterium microcysteis]
MITLYTWATPNGRKVSIMLEECGLRYSVKPIDISRGDQFDPAFLAMNPNNKIPVLVDDEGPDGQPITLFESGAILVYLAAKTGRLLPADDRGRFEALQWLMFQMGGLGPMLGQAHHFLRFAPEAVPYAMKRYSDEARRLYGVLEGRLAQHVWLAADTYTIADIAAFPWIDRHDYQHIDLADYPKVQAWHARIAERPAVQRGMKVPA